MSFREKIEHAIRPLTSTTMTVVSARNEPQLFGNTEIILTSATYKVRFLCDRAQFFVDVAAVDAVKWNDLTELMATEGFEMTTAVWETPEAAVAALQRLHDVIPSWLRRQAERPTVTQRG